MSINLNYLISILVIIILYRLIKLSFSIYYSKKLKKIFKYEFNNIRCNVYSETKGFSFRQIKKSYNIYIIENHIYLVPSFSMSIFGDDIISTNLYFKSKETQIIDKIFLNENNKIKIEYYPLDNMSILDRVKFSIITINGLDNDQKIILKEIINKYCS